VKVVVVIAAVGALACGSSSPPLRRADYQVATDGGLTPPQPPARKGVIVPSDVGVGPGTVGAPGPSPAAPPTGTPGITN
jgi:hypothetical protein